MLTVLSFNHVRDWTWVELSQKPSKSARDYLVKRLGGRFTSNQNNARVKDSVNGEGLWYFKTRIARSEIDKAVGLEPAPKTVTKVTVENLEAFAAKLQDELDQVQAMLEELKERA